ncbi:MbnP family protein [Meiothermus sp.]|uniref:MbnP family protein n=1 Tax=Meiothermus sp. TaxID=1955249 RepID=UPI00307E8835
MNRWFLSLVPLLLTGVMAAPVELKINLRIGDQPMQFGQTYQTPQGQRYQIDMLKFYISDLALVRPDGSEVKVDGLVLADFKRDAPTQGVSVVKMDVPAGQYRGIRFNVGVPRELNHLDAATQQLPLGVNSGMYWAWNPGYIFYRLEGRALLPEGSPKWVIHMGTDTFRLPVRLHDLQTRRVQINIPSGGGSILLNLDVAKAFEPGPGGVFLDWRKQSLRQLHGLGPETALLMSVVYFNMQSAFSLAQ